MSSLLTRLGIRFTLEFPRARAPGPRVRGPARKAARAAVACGVIGFALATAGLAVSLETAKPEWRDPEFGHRLRQIRRWKAEAPDRPLVLVFGSSRTQMGVSPAAMGMPSGPTDPLVYNFGYRGGQPVWAWLNLMRLLDAGVQPDFVLVHLSLAEAVSSHPAERQFAAWGSRLSIADMRRLRPYTNNPRYFPARWAASRLGGWSAFAEGMRSDLLPDWQRASVRRSYSWERMDRYGFIPHPSEHVTAARREELQQDALRRHVRSISGHPPSELTRRVNRDLVERCRAEGIAVAFAWTPESPRYRAAYGPAGPETVAQHSRFITRELGAVVFAAPDHLAESDFADGYHLLDAGAEKYSRWLGDTHLKPWLARRGR